MSTPLGTTVMAAGARPRADAVARRRSSDTATYLAPGSGLAEQASRVVVGHPCGIGWQGRQVMHPDDESACWSVGRKVMERGHERKIEAHRGHVVEDHAVGGRHVWCQRGADACAQVRERWRLATGGHRSRHLDDPRVERVEERDADCPDARHADRPPAGQEPDVRVARQPQRVVADDRLHAADHARERVVDEEDRRAGHGDGGSCASHSRSPPTRRPRACGGPTTTRCLPRRAGDGPRCGRCPPGGRGR